MATTPGSPFTFVLIGAGRVGTAVAELLRRGGAVPVGVSSRSAASADRAAGLLDVPALPPDRLPPSDVVLLGVPDAALADVAAAVATHIYPAAVVVHFSGASGIAPLEQVVPAGASTCALHPVQACPDIETAIDRLPGSYWGVTTSPGAMDWADHLVRDYLRGRPLVVEEGDRPVWHAAAVSTSNGIAALMAVGESLLRTIGIDAPEAVLGPLARGTVENAIAGGGGARTLTGPAVRGEKATLAAHLEAISATAPELIAGYTLAAKLVVEGAALESRIAPDEARAILELLGDKG